MAVPFEQFVKHLEDSGVLVGDTLRDFIPPKASPKDGQELLRELIRQRKLTKFQAEELSKGKGKSLVLGNYVLLEKIGQGGMGAVYKAEHRRMHRIVAIKMLPTAMTKDPAAIARFEREVTAAAKLEHPNIVTAHDADQANGVHFLVMQYVEGSDLAALVKKNGPFPVEQAVNYILQAAKGLEFAHGESVVHRDIKPANLLLDKRGTVKVLDMGLARIDSVDDAAPQAELTSTGAVMGTVDYMSPEQALDTKTADARADIYSLGCSLFYLLTGKATYQGDTLVKKILAHREQPIPSIQAIRPEVPEQVEAVFRKMVAKRVEDRYQTMSRVIADLEKFGKGNEQTVDFSAPIGSASDTGLTNFLREISSAPQKPVHTKKPASPLIGKGKKRLLLIGGGILGVLILLAAVVVKLTTQDGTPIVTVNEPDADVQVLSEAGKVEISQKGGKGVIEISVDPGKPITGFNSPAFQQWITDVASLPAEKQVEAVSKKLQELNQGFDGKLRSSDGFYNDNETPTIENGVVTELHLISDDVTDLSPLQAFVGLRSFKFTAGSDSGRRAKLTDLSPLGTLKALKNLNVAGTKVSDLKPLRGTSLEGLVVINTPVTDLGPLEGMTSLKRLLLGWNQITDLSPLKGTSLTLLQCRSTSVSDLSPIASLPLTTLHLAESLVFDLSPLEGMRLTTLTFTPKNITKGIDVIRRMQSLKAIGYAESGKDRFPPTEFWKKYDAGEFGQPTPQ